MSLSQILTKSGTLDGFLTKGEPHLQFCSSACSIFSLHSPQCDRKLKSCTSIHVNKLTKGIDFSRFWKRKNLKTSIWGSWMKSLTIKQSVLKFSLTKCVPIYWVEHTRYKGQTWGFWMQTLISMQEIFWRKRVWLEIEQLWWTKLLELRLVI